MKCTVFAFILRHRGRPQMNNKFQTYEYETRMGTAFSSSPFFYKEAYNVILESCKEKPN